MSHPTTLLKEYLNELSERLTELDTKLDDKIRTLSEQISSLNAKLDGKAQMTNEILAKLGSKQNGGMRALRETISRLDDRLDSSVQTTNQAIRELYREKLSVQAFREFLNIFNKILRESFPLRDERAAQSSGHAVPESRADDTSYFIREHAAIPGVELDTPRYDGTALSSRGEGSSQIVLERPSARGGDQVSLPQIEETALPEVTVGEGISKHVGFPMSVAGESFYVGDGLRSIVGDVEIPPGTTVDETLVVKGNFRARECCKLLRNVKAFKDIEIGDYTTVEGTLVSGGRVTVHPNCVVKGSIESEGDIEIGENVIVKKHLSSKSSVLLSKSAQVSRAINARKGVLRT